MKDSKNPLPFELQFPPFCEDDGGDSLVFLQTDNSFPKVKFLYIKSETWKIFREEGVNEEDHTIIWQEFGFLVGHVSLPGRGYVDVEVEKKLSMLRNDGSLRAEARQIKFQALGRDGLKKK